MLQWLVTMKTVENSVAEPRGDVISKNMRSARDSSKGRLPENSDSFV